MKVSIINFIDKKMQFRCIFLFDKIITSGYNDYKVSD